MVERTVTVRNAHGIHCRPSALIIKEVAGYGGAMHVVAQHGETDLRSIFGLLSLGLEQGAVLTVRVTGPDEATQCARLAELFEHHFDFPPLSTNGLPAPDPTAKENAT